MFDKIVVVSRKTRLAELIERFNTRAQAKFYIERAGGNFADYVDEDAAYQRSMEIVLRQLALGLKLQRIDRALVPTYLFSDRDLIVTVGQDGLVANTARYAGAQPIVAVNPDPARFDGVLLPFAPSDLRAAVTRTIERRAPIRAVTLAEASLADGQRLVAFNDLFIGARSHVSARYRITIDEVSEDHSSSGVLVSTGAGSTGWMSSVFNMASGVAAFTGGSAGPARTLGWEDPRLLYVVREPFRSRHSQATMIAGMVESGHSVTLESLMPSGGVIFGDGVETDFLAFESGATATLRAAAQRAQLVAR
ncbi:MAG: NAD+ kinase [Deltaproteobacteria bacterium]|nr:NAD+ kinase [Deltaproteobacteria bacterium]